VVPFHGVAMTGTAHVVRELQLRIVSGHKRISSTTIEELDLQHERTD
jgi:hypothetical protein